MIQISNFAKAIFSSAFLITSLTASGQRDRAQIPAVFNDSYIEVNVGYINYPFGSSSLEPGYTYRSVNVPHVAVRIIMAGHQFNKYLSAQLSYMRPVLWVKYTYTNGLTSLDEKKSLWMNVAGATIKPQLPLSDRFMIYGEGGLGIITRHGIRDNMGNTVVKNTTYAYPLMGGGIKYSINDNWKLMLSLVYSPGNKDHKQPSTSYLSTGFSYMMHTLSDEKVAEKNKAGYKFPKQMIQAGYANNFPGYGINRTFANEKFPLFWLGDAYVQQGFSISYLRNIFHGRKIFSFDWGTSMGFWKGKNEGEEFITISAFPLFRWTLVHSKPADFYLLYSLAGPTYISTKMLDKQELGGNFTFQDFMGAGFFTGKERKFSVEFHISHFSNGNLYPRNAGVCVPLSMHLGYAF
ncbi:MAG TPA: acyloxyacyl hydrolase [Bacteroidales bacterium]|nr:acyloxyacyl hydrolase [Bacteroidales bacterium]